MLVLSRKPGEEVIIGGDICITLLEIRGNRARLGITAPDGVSIWRKELCISLGSPNLIHASGPGETCGAELEEIGS